MGRKLAFDLYCGKGGWAYGLLDAGFDVIGFDIERHADYPGQLVIQDVLTICGSQLRDAALIVSSSPCQKYSYMAMPWTRAKAMATWYREDPARQVELNALFDASFRIQREASEAAGRHIPLVAENVKGAQPWVGRAKWHYGSFYLWGDVPALMPPTSNGRMKFWANYGPRLWKDRDVPRLNNGENIYKGFGGSWFAQNHNTNSGSAGNPVSVAGGFKTTGHINKRNGHDDTRHLTNPAEHEGVKQGGEWWHDSTPGHIRSFSSKSDSRKAASAQIAMIPYPLARWIGEVYCN